MALANSGLYENPAEKGQWDAQSQNNIDRNARQYRDLDLNFRKISGSGDIGKVTDIQAIKRPIRNLVFLNRFEKPFQPNVYGGVIETLFEPVNTMTAILIGNHIESLIVDNEPRVVLEEVNVMENMDSYGYEVQIIFIVVNNPVATVDLTLMLERLR